jgi:radical SAM family uncharacterized protein/radical SAM-linked protein
MSDYLKSFYEKILPYVEKPSRYLGGELHQIKKDPARVKTRILLAFPETYNLGMSHLGFKILYHILNLRPDLWAQRTFAPWVDAEALHHKHQIPLLSWESGTPLYDFDIVGFSLQYELTYSNILTMLKLGKVPFYSAQRRPQDPLIIAGGPGAFSPEPLAEIFDLILLGDGEEAFLEIIEAYQTWRRGGASRENFLQAAAQIPGVYVPSLYEPQYDERGNFLRIAPRAGVPPLVEKRVVNLAGAAYPTCPVVSFAEVVHDRAVVEIARGCNRGCRFCQAGIIYRPARERSPREVMELCRRILAHTGMEEVSLASLSSGDYLGLEEIVAALIEEWSRQKVSVSLPSLRPEAVKAPLAAAIQKIRKTGFTLAPEAGSLRLRKVINKEISEEGLLASVQAAARLGWESIKLYFMLGLPTETLDDVEAIARLVFEIRRAAKAVKKGSFALKVSASSFVPKAHTPFQWAGQEEGELLREKQRILAGRLGGKSIDFSAPSVEMSFWEAVFSRGDRRLTPALIKAWESGCRFDGWSDQFKAGLWQKAFTDTGLNPAYYANRSRELGEALPWDHLSPGVDKGYLLSEYMRSLEETVTHDCRFAGYCQGCRACPDSSAYLAYWQARAQETLSLLPPPGKESLPPQAPMKMRFRWGKREPLKYLSHLELLRAWGRAFRRAGIPLSYSQGFNPQPKISLGLALPVSWESTAEYMDVTLQSPVTPREVLSRLQAHLPLGLEVYEAKTISRGGPSLNQTLGLAEYQITAEKKEDLGDEIGWRDFLAQEEIIITRQKARELKEINLRPFLVTVGPSAEEDKTLRMKIKITAGQSLRPEEVLAAYRSFRQNFGKPESASPLWKVQRTALWIEKDGNLLNPMI